jgi:hypothetical protein
MPSDQEILDTTANAAKSVGGSSGSYDTTKTVAQYAATAAAVGGPVGATAGAVAVTAATIFDSLKGVFVSPSPTWTEANILAVPTATQLTTRIINDLGAQNIQKIFDLYVVKLKAYIKGSPHNPTQTDNFINAIDTEAVGMRGGWREDAFTFDVTIQKQLAWAIWLHSLWLYGGVSKNEIPNGNANRKFTDSLIPTLQAAIVEGTGNKIDMTTGANVTEKATVTTASMFSGTFAKVALVGAAVGLLFFAAKGKR